MTLLTPVPEGSIAETVKEILEKLLTLIGVEGTVIPQNQPEIDEEEAAESASFNIRGDDLGILIGRRGQTLTALQYIVRLIVGNQMKTWLPITIDIEGYKQRRYQALQDFAHQMAEQVKTRERPFTMEPMPAYERRIIHLTLADHPDVTTESIGQGESRRVVISPRRR